MLKKIFCSAIIVLAILNLQAQKKWTLTDCINFAQDHNIDLKLGRLSVESNFHREHQALMSILPSLNASANYGFNFGRTTQPDNTSANSNNQTSRIGLSSNFGIIDVYRKLLEKKRLSSEREASLEEVEQLTEDISLSVTAYFLNILLNKEIVKIAEDNLKTTELEIERARLLVESGDSPKSFLIERKAQAAKEELELTNAQNQVDLAKLNLAQLLNIEDVDNFDISDPEIKETENTYNIVNAKTIYLQSLALRPELRAAKHKLEGSETALSLAKTQAWPTLKLFGNVFSNYSNDYPELGGLDANNRPLIIRQEMRFFDQIKDRRFWGFGLQLDIPIFNGYSVSKDIALSKLDIQRQELNIEKTKDNIRKTIQEAVANAKAAYNKYLSSKAAVEASQEAFKYVEEKFKLGLANNVEYNQEKSNLFNAKSSLIQSKYEYIFRYKILDYYLGKKISL